MYVDVVKKIQACTRKNKIKACDKGPCTCCQVNIYFLAKNTLLLCDGHNDGNNARIWVRIRLCVFTLALQFIAWIRPIDSQQEMTRNLKSYHEYDWQNHVPVASNSTTTSLYYSHGSCRLAPLLNQSEVRHSTTGHRTDGRYWSPTNIEDIGHGARNSIRS